MTYYDRPATRFGGNLTEVIRTIIIINTCIFVPLFLFKRFNPHIFHFILYYFSLIPVNAFTKLMVWQFATYMFIHFDIWHILFNLLMLWLFGGEIENLWGTKKFTLYYLGTGALAGVFSGIISFLFFHNPSTPLVGASGAIYGVLAAFGYLFRDRIILVFFLFPMRAKYAVILFGIINLYFSLNSNDLGAVAHLSGMVFGFIYLYFMNNYPKIIQERKNQIHRKKVTNIEQKRLQRRDFYREKIDPILDKISEKGMDSLTKEERRILEQAKHFKKD